jgi:hypothetical protein
MPAAAAASALRAEKAIADASDNCLRMKYRATRSGETI